MTEFKGFTGRPLPTPSLVQYALQALELSTDTLDHRWFDHKVNMAQYDQVGQLFIYASILAGTPHFGLRPAPDIELAGGAVSLRPASLRGAPVFVALRWAYCSVLHRWTVLVALTWSRHRRAPKPDRSDQGNMPKFS